MVAAEYGERLQSHNVKEGAIAKLLMGYPSHGFVIDKTEAATLFKRVRELSPDEYKLVLTLLPLIQEGQEQDHKGEPAKVMFLSRMDSENVDSHTGEPGHVANESKPGAPAGVGAQEGGATSGNGDSNGTGQAGNGEAPGPVPAATANGDE